MTAIAAERAARNFARTYLRLGVAVPKSEIVEDAGFVACTGPLEHGASNFALNLRLDDQSVERLKDLAIAHPSFQLYALPTDEPPDTSQMLRRASFHRAYSLALMTIPGGQPTRFDVTAVSPERQHRVARFMVDMFFGRETAEVKRAISWAIATAPGLELCEVVRDDQLIAAAMVSRSSEELGLYNLCVAPPYRRQRIGSSLVRWAIGAAGQSGVGVTLQCNADMEPWYRAQGFDSVGKVHVFTLDSHRTAVIMKQE